MGPKVVGENMGGSQKLFVKMKKLFVKMGERILKQKKYLFLL